METRVLTLFDDEEFFPKEPPKEKPKKEKAVKTAANAVSGEDEPEGEPKMTEPGPSIFKEEDIPVTAFESERLVDDKIPENEAAMVYRTAVANEEAEFVTEPEHSEDERLVDDKVVPENEALVIHDGLDADEELQAVTGQENDEADIINEDLTEAAPQEADKELNQQILSELIQLDYTALMQKNYAFDLNSATVINKELPKEKPAPVVESNDEEVVEEEVFEEVTPLPEWNLDKKYYTIGEVAQLFAVNTSHIRFWTNEFKLKPRTTRKGDRLYSPKDIAELRLIHHLVKEKKHTIKGAREKLKAEKTGVNNKLDLKESLLELKSTLLKIREQL